MPSLPLVHDVGLDNMSREAFTLERPTRLPVTGGHEL
jgi:hypothetical protein